MKTTLILAAAAGVLAQNLSGMPACATSCISAAVSSAGCAQTDVACQCGTAQAPIATIAGACVLGACPASEISNVIAAGSALCAAAASTTGVTASTSRTTGTVSATLSNNSTTVVAPVTTSTGSVTLTGTNGTLSTSSSGSGSGGTVVTSTTTSPGGTGGTGTTARGGSTTSTANPNAAATPAILGAGALVGFLGFAAAL